MNLFRKAVRKIFNRYSFMFNRVGSRRFYSNVAKMRGLFNRISKVEGDIVECGVGRAYSFQILASLLLEEGSKRKLWGFDSFEGFPEPSAEDEGPRKVKKGEWKYLDAEDVPKFLFILGFKKKWLDPHIRIVKGFFSDTLPKSEISKIAFLHLDVDLYDSYKTCLQYLFPKVSKGGVVLLDEYMNKKENFKFPGAQKAIDEYFASTNQTILRDSYSGKYFLIKE